MVGLAPGSLLHDRYRVLEVLGRGSMGVAYRVRDEAADVERVVKLMGKAAAESPRAVVRFEREASLGKRLKHPGIVASVDFGELPDGGRYLVMEYAPGVNLDAWLDAHPDVDNQARLSLSLQLLAAAAAAHEQDVVHRDLKPDNLLVHESEDGPVLRILDFGISKHVALAASRTEAGLGTPMWTAPEQAAPDYSPTKQDDVWALGLLVFYILSGKPYWRSLARRESAASMALELLRSEIVSASQRAEDLGANPLGAGFDAWFARCVNRQPERRFADAAEAQRALETCDADADAADPALTAASGPPALSDDYGADRPRQVGLPAPVVVGLLVGSAMLMWYAIYWLITHRAS